MKESVLLLFVLAVALAVIFLVDPASSHAECNPNGAYIDRCAHPHL